MENGNPDTIVQPNRFVYHISQPTHRRSIDRKGLLPFMYKERDRAVYANNLPVSKIRNWYPVFYDEILLWELNKEIYETAFYSLLCSYDIWRIDTTLIRNQWFKDKWISFPDEIGHDHILTFDPIPRSAIYLFEYVKPHFKLYRNNGCASAVYKYGVHPVTRLGSFINKISDSL